jgi:hypothetical protein
VESTIHERALVVSILQRLKNGSYCIYHRKFGQHQRTGDAERRNRQRSGSGHSRSQLRFASLGLMVFNNMEDPKPKKPQAAVFLSVNLPPETIDRVAEYRHLHGFPSKTAAIRFLLEKGMDHLSPRKGVDLK